MLRIRREISCKYIFFAHSQAAESVACAPLVANLPQNVENLPVPPLAANSEADPDGRLESEPAGAHALVIHTHSHENLALTPRANVRSMGSH